MAIHHLRKWSLKYKVREENKTLSLFCPAIIFWMMMRPSITLTKNWMIINLQPSSWFWILHNTNSPKSESGWSTEKKSRCKECFFDFLMKLEEGFPTSLHLDSWCFAVWWTESLVLWHVCQRMFVSSHRDSTIRRRLLSKFLLRFSRFYHLEESAIRPKVSAHMIRTFPRWYKGPIRP